MGEIGQAMGGRTASTAAYAIEKVERLLTQAEMQLAIAEIERGFTQLDWLRQKIYPPHRFRSF